MSIQSTASGTDTVEGQRTDTRTKKRTRTEIEAAGEIERALQQLGLDISLEQFAALQGTRGLQDLLGGQLSALLSPGSLADIEARAGQAGQLTDQENQLISQAASLGFAQGASDIQAAVEQGMQSLRQELAPSRGLRPSDTPIIDRGGDILKAQAQALGNLSLGLQQQAAQNRLQFPLQRQAFQEQLRNQAFMNRLNLSGQLGQLGLGLSGLFNPAGFQSLGLQERIAGRDVIERGSGREDQIGVGSGRGQSHTGSYDFGGMGGMGG